MNENLVALYLLATVIYVVLTVGSLAIFGYWGAYWITRGIYAGKRKGKGW